MFKSWMNTVNAYLYSHPKEDFSIWEGVQEAVKENKIVVVLDKRSFTCDM